jgi:hypothetical protein
MSYRPDYGATTQKTAIFVLIAVRTSNLTCTVMKYVGVKPGLLLREGQRFRMFENSVLRKIFGPKRDKVTGRPEKTV